MDGSDQFHGTFALSKTNALPLVSHHHADGLSWYLEDNLGPALGNFLTSASSAKQLAAD